MYYKSKTAAIILTIFCDDFRRFLITIRRSFCIIKNDYTIINGRIFIYDRLFILNYGEARFQILYKIHSSVPGDYLDYIKIYDLFR